jgi:hypothetical protein
MKEICIPRPAKLKEPQPDGTVRDIELSYEAFLDGQVWCLPEWRNDAEWGNAFERLVDAFDGKSAGDNVYVSDVDFEKFAPLATMKGKTVAAQHAKALTRLMNAVTFAKHAKSAPSDSKPETA